MRRLVLPLLLLASCSEDPSAPHRPDLTSGAEDLDLVRAAVTVSKRCVPPVCEDSGACMFFEPTDIVELNCHVQVGGASARCSFAAFPFGRGVTGANREKMAVTLQKRGAGDWCVSEWR